MKELFRECWEASYNFIINDEYMNFEEWYEAYKEEIEAVLKKHYTQGTDDNALINERMHK